MSQKHKAMGIWQIRPNENIFIPISNAVLAEAFFRKYGLDRVISGFKKKGTDLGKLAELLVAYKLGDNFSIFKAHGFITQPEIRRRFGINEFNVKGLYHAVERLGGKHEAVIGAFKNRTLKKYGQDVVDVIFNRTSLVYFGYKPELAMHGRSKDGHPEECRMAVGISQLAKPRASR